MLDPQDEAYDRRLAKHLVSLYHQTPEEEEEVSMVSMMGRGGEVDLRAGAERLT